MQRVKLQINDQKEYYCPSLVTQDEWRKYLDTLDSQGNGRKIDVLLMFYRQAGHKATCGAIGKEYGMSANGISTIIWNIGKQVQLYLGNKFSVERADKEEDAYWPILMLGKDSSNGFEWTVRPELCAAIYDFLIAKVISRYKDIVISEGIDNSASKELYKWQIISQSQGRSTKGMFYKLTC